MEYWIDGYFFEWWTHKSYRCGDRYISVPKFATVKIIDTEPYRIYIKKSFALKQLAEWNRLKDEKRLNLADNRHILLNRFCEALNVPWVKEPYVEPHPKFKTSLY